MSNLCLQDESPGSPLQFNQLRTAASDTGFAALTHAFISNGCHGRELSRMIVSCVCMQMSSRVVFAKADRGNSTEPYLRRPGRRRGGRGERSLQVGGQKTESVLKIFKVTA